VIFHPDVRFSARDSLYPMALVVRPTY